MIPEFALLAGRIRRESADLEKALHRAVRAGKAALRQAEDSDLYVDAAAINLHDFYTGLERIFQQVATVVDETVPGGPDWHKDLLEHMCVELPGTRPALLSDSTCRALGEIMRFRHVVRNVYSYNFDAERVARLLEDALKILGPLKAELDQFATFLEQVDREELD